MVMGSSEYKGILSKYNSVGQVKQRGSGDGNKKLNFLTSYYSETGDLTLATAVKKNKGEDGMSQSGGSSESDTDNTQVDDGDITGSGDDAIEIAKAAASTFVHPSDVTTVRSERCYGIGLSCYSQSKADTVSSSKYCLRGTQKELIWDGKTIVTERRDCSALGAVILCAAGITNTRLSSYSKTWYDGPSGFTSFDVGNKTFAECKLYDILVWRQDSGGHVAVVIKIDGDKVYTADAGSKKAIASTAEKGYYEVFNKTDKISSWRSGKPIRICRKD